MVVSSVLKRLLWVLRYPFFDSKLVGQYQDVGAIQVRIPNGVQCQIHYPTESRKSATKTPYFRAKAVTGLADYVNMSDDILGFLSLRQHPCHINTPPIPGKTFPIVVFSHGLGGCMEQYTQLCQHVSSCGFWVVALEHEDGSGCYAETIDGTPIYYKRPDDSPYSRDKVINFRRSFLQQRIQETTDAVDYIFSSSKDALDAPTQSVFDAADTSKKVSLLGHSFGAATMTLVAQQYKSHPPTSVSLLDCWAFSLDDETLTTGIQSSVPTLSVLSEAWLTNPETAQVKQLLRNSDNVVSSVYAPKSVHASVSDSSVWLPEFILRRMGLRGKGEKAHVTIRAAAQASARHFHKFLGDTVDNNDDHPESDLLPPFSYEMDGDDK